MNLARHEIDLYLERLRRHSSWFSLGSSLFIALYLVMTLIWHDLYSRNAEWFQVALLVGVGIPTGWSYHLQGIMKGLREAVDLLDPPPTSQKSDDHA